MNPQDVNPLLDPEKVPIPPSSDGRTRLHRHLDNDSLDLLGSVERGPVAELNEEPPWLAELLAHYKLMFGNSPTVAAVQDRHERVRIVQPSPASYHVPPKNPDIADFGEIDSGQTNEQANAIEPPPREIFEYPVSAGWSWIHVALAVTLAALLAGLVLMFVRPTRQPKGNSVAAPIVSANLPTVQAAAAVPAADTPAAAVSHDDARPTVPLRKVLPVYPRAALAEKLEGSVSLQAEISQEGRVLTVTVLSGEPILAQAAVEAVRKWVYPPSIQDQDEPRQQQVTIHFKAP